MSKDYYLFENESGETAYLAGIVEVLSNNLSLVCDFGYSFEVDIFYMKDNDFNYLENSLKKRFYSYTSQGGRTTIKDIDKLNFKFDILKTDVKKYVFNAFSKYSHSKDLQKSVDKFFLSLNWYLQEPTCIYTLSKGISGKVGDVLGDLYMYMAFNYFFVGYDEYAVLFVFGTSE